MKNSSTSKILICLALLAPLAFTQTPNSAPPTTAALTGDVTLIPSDSGQHVNDSSRVIVWLSPLDPVQLVRSNVAKQQHFRVVQHNKRFEPSLLVVPVGSIVDFPNLDPWFHNVFSLYRGKRFDLGLYQAGAHKEIRFDRPGASYIFCNIHPEMAAVIMTVDSNFYGISDKLGHVSIPNVPAGKYLLHVWYEHATPEALMALDGSVDIEAESANLPAISVPVTQQTAAKHKNKYGQDYDPKAGASDYQN